MNQIKLSIILVTVLIMHTHYCNGLNGQAVAQPQYNEQAAAQLFKELDGSASPDQVKKWIDKGADINAKNKKGETPLIIAVRGGQDSIVELLFGYKNLDFKARDNLGFSVAEYVYMHNDEPILQLLQEHEALPPLSKEQQLFVDVLAGNEQGVEELLDEGVTINATTSAGVTPLMLATRDGNQDLITLLLNHKADVSLKDKQGKTAFDYANEYAKMFGNTDIPKMFRSVQAKPLNPKEQLFDSVESSDNDAVKKLLAAGGDANSTNEEGNSLLMLASRQGYANVVATLLEHGVSINAVNGNNNQNALMLAAGNNHLDVVKLLLDKGADSSQKLNGKTTLQIAYAKGYTDIVNLFASKGHTVSKEEQLFAAIEKGNLNEVQRLIAAGVDSNAKNIQGATPLIQAVRYNKGDIAKVLIAARAKVNEVDQYGNTALTTAASYNRDIASAQALLAAGADVNVQSKQGTPLIHAASANNVAMIKLLIGAHANVNLTDGGGITPLMIAAQKNSLDGVKLLVESGADVNAADKNGDTAWHAAQLKGYTDIVTYLVQHGVKVMPEQQLFVAAKNGDLKTVQDLVAKNPQAVGLTNSFGETPLIMASEAGHEDIVQFLLDKGAKVNAKNKSGHTALIVATDNNHPFIANLLLTKGADVNMINNNGVSALWHGLGSDIEKLLLNAPGVKVNMLNNDGQTVLFQVTDLPDAQLLFEHGVDVNIVDKNGETVLDYAREKEEQELADFLKSKGAKTGQEIAAQKKEAAVPQGSK